MNKKIFWALISSLTLILFKANLVLAQSSDVTGVNDLANAGVNLAQTDLKQVIANIINVFLGFLGVIAVVLILYAGYLWMMSKGETEKIKKAKDIMVSAVIGLVIILSAYAIASFVLNKLYEATNPDSNPNNNGGNIVNPIVVPPDCPEPEDDSVKVCKIKPDNTGASVGQYITIEGWNFEEYLVANSKVKFDGNGVIQEASLINCNGQVAWSRLDNRPENYFRIKAIVPNVALGNYRIKINTATNQEGSYPESPATFEVRSGTPGPGIACVTPSSQRRGQGIDIEGIGFGNSGQIKILNWNGDIWQRNLFSNWNTWTDTHITNAIVPNEALSGELFIEVGGLQSAPESFNVLCNDGQADCVSGCCAANACVDADYCLDAAGHDNGPVISRISPNTGQEGSLISIYGSGFGATGGRVFFEGNNASEQPGIEPSSLNSDCTQYWSDNLIIVGVPQDTLDGDADVWVEHADGRDSNSKMFDDSGAVAPSICRLDPSDGSFGDLVNIYGLNFANTDSAFFGGVSGALTFESIQKAKVTVPNLAVGELNVWLKNTSDKSSNELPFSVGAAGGGEPIISSINPDNAPVGQYITIFGSNFGNTAGRVEFINASGDSTLADVNFPNQCAGNYWHNDNIVVKVPVLPVATYQIKVKRNSDQASSNSYNFNVQTGNPGPGLCLMQPNNGPANNLFSINLYGDNFSNSGQVNFSGNQTGIVNSWNNQLVNVRVPNNTLTGPVKIRVNNQDSNALNFAVSNCTNDNQCGANQECCQQATGNYCDTIGHCVEDLACEYSWTVTTAADPFSLREVACDPDAHNLSSPSPWPDGLEGRLSRDAYLDANISALFNADVADEDFNTTNIQVKVCNTGAEFDNSTCSANVPVNLSIINHNSDSEGFVLNPGDNLTANKWYKVVLGTFHKAHGNEVWSGSSYNWHFRTQEDLCQADSIVVTPTNSPTADIYVAHTREFNASPLAGNCNICGANYNWSNWTLQGPNASRASIENQIVSNTNIARAWVKGLEVTENRNPATVELRASLNSLMSLAYPKIKDAILEVIDYGPNCNSSCTNALVWADFNTILSQSSLAGNVQVYLCTDANCDSLSGGNLVTDLVLSEDGHRLNILHDNFLAERYYKVSLSQGLENIAGYHLSSNFNWNFSTNGDAACVPSSLNIDPAYYLAVNDSPIDYFATPYSAANACDPNGQALSPMAYTYQWTLDPSQVANLQNSATYHTTVTPRNDGVARINSSIQQYSVSDQATLEVNFSDVSVYPEPKISDTKPQTPACLNSAVEVQFNTLMDRASVEAGMHLYKNSPNEQANCVRKDSRWYCPVATSFVFTNNNNQSKAWLYPTELLTANTAYLALVSGSVRSNMGVDLADNFLNFDSDSNMVNDSHMWIFETNSQMCQVSFVIVDPNQDLFNCSRSNCLDDTNRALDGNQHSYIATAYDASGSPLVMQTYHWQENNALLTLVNNNNQSIQATAANQNGETSLIATVSDPQAGSATGSSQVNLFLCEHPWPRQATNFPYDFPNSPQPDYHFNTYYCQDSGRENEPLLPYLDANISPKFFPEESNNLVEFIFIVDPKQTIIAKSDENIKPSWWRQILAKVKNTVLASIAIPSAPTNLVLADNSADGVKLSWSDNATNEDGFNIYRKSSTVDWYKLATVENSNQSTIYFTDNNVINNEVYNYRVTAYNAGGESTATNEITVTAKATSVDVIGVRVMKNTEHLSINDWYAKYAPNPGIAGQAQVIDGYPALKVGNTVYISALNVADENGGPVYSNIYVISYNIGARVSTADIVTQMLANLHLSDNIANVGVCTSDPSVSCSSKFDCPGISNCDASGDKLRRDNQRLGDLLNIQNKLIVYSNNYKFCNHNGNISCTQDSQCPSGGECVPYYPLLNAGTYVAGMSVSPWPSWQQEFSSVLGGVLPVDPLNRFNICSEASGFDPETCWNETSHEFSCPANSSIYLYKNEGGDSYALDANFEFVYDETAFNFSPALDSHIHRNNPQCDAVFEGSPQGSLGCGNGVIEGAEECDGGFRNLCDATLNNNQDWWNEHLGGCYPRGSVDADGQLVECKWYVPNPTLTEAMCGGFCGNNIIETPHELCEGTNFGNIEYSCLDGSQATCSFCSLVCGDGSLASVATCGDGVVNSTEECDGTNLDGQTCVGLEYDQGVLGCSQCNFDISDCSDEEPVPPPPPSCGNGAIDPPEQCDGNNLNGQTCVGLGYDQGTLSCNESCDFNRTNCSYIAGPPPASCGNNIQEGTELCDGIDLNNQTCQTQNFDSGSLYCNQCVFDTSSCINFQAVSGLTLSLEVSCMNGGAVCVPRNRRNVTLMAEWDSVLNADHYQAQRKTHITDPWSGNVSVTDPAKTWISSSVSIPGEAQFRVRACDSQNNCGDWSESAIVEFGVSEF